MIFAMKPFLIDIIVTFFVLVMIIYGYIKGFTVRIYDFMATIVALLTALFVSAPLSKMIVIYKIDDVLLQSIGSFINRIIIFMILLVVIKLVLVILGKFIKPIISGILNKISIVNQFDKLLGVILSFIQSIIIVYLVLILVVSPIFTNGLEVIDETIITKYILDIVPDITAQVEDMTDNFKVVSDVINQGLGYDGGDGNSAYGVALALNNSYTNNLIDNQQLINAIDEYFGDIENITVTPDQYQEINNLLNNANYNNASEILKKITVSENNESN